MFLGRTLFFLLLLLSVGCVPGAGAPGAPGRATAAPEGPSSSLPTASPTKWLPTAAPTTSLATTTPTTLLTTTATVSLPVVVTASAPWSLLLFTRTAGFRHASIADGVAAIEALGTHHGFEVLHTEDAALFSDEMLAGFRVVVFLSTTGDVLDAAQQAAFERYIQGGGAFVGVHAASDTEYAWPWYGGLIGAYFANHPAVQSAALTVVEPNHASTQMLPATWTRTDEWYNFATDPTGQVDVLLNLEESSYDGGTMGASHPIAWYQEYDGGRSWYTAGGHTSASFEETLFVEHLAGGILWAAQAVADP